jgi:hypothetical protein
MKTVIKPSSPPHPAEVNEHLGLAHFTCVFCCDCRRKVPKAYTVLVPDWEHGGFAPLCFTCDPWIVRDGNAPVWGPVCGRG